MLTYVLEALAVDLGVKVDGVLASDNVREGGALLLLTAGGLGSASHYDRLREREVGGKRSAFNCSRKRIGTALFEATSSSDRALSSPARPLRGSACSAAAPRLC